MSDGALRRTDLPAAAALAAAGAALAWWGSGVIGPGIRDWSWIDLWFQSDAPRVFENLTRRTSDHYRSNVHPLFSGVGFAAVTLLRQGLRLTAPTAARTFGALVAAAWASGLFLLLRLWGIRTAEAVLLGLVGLGSGAAVLWLTVPETYALGSLTLMLPLMLLAWSRHRPVPGWAWVLASATSLSITVTNWMAGLAASLRALGWRRAAVVSVGAFALVAALWLVQRHYFPSTLFFVSREEQEYLRWPFPGRVARVAAVFALDAIVLPRPSYARAAPQWLTLQRSIPGSGGAAAAVAVIAWALLLGLGLVEAARRLRRDGLVQVLLACLAGQLALHLVYGEETILYAVHWLPLLMLLAGLAFLGSRRRLALLLAGVVLAAGVPHNLGRLGPMADLVGTQRQQVLRQMTIRPGDPWPRGTAHVVLGRPGSPDTAKGYLEPGGSLSPVPGSFGVSIWVRDSGGRLAATSDGIPLEQVSQTFDWSSSGLPPPVVTTTPWYTARWTYDGEWRLVLSPARGARLELVLRSVGPAGGPVRRLVGTGRELRVNDRWRVVVRPDPETVVLGDERGPGWTEASAGDSAWQDEAGWGFARFRLTAGATSELTITGVPEGQVPLASLPQLDLPDPEFEASLRAQVAHLLMGTVGDETRSADPLNAPVPWQRTGAYIIVALARVGQIDRARALAELLLRRDYYGGFGAEADAPGLGIWALAEVAAELGDSAYDHRIWPAVRRKALRIEGFLDARDTIRVRVPNPPVPRYRNRPDLEIVAAPSRDGLVIGKMDHGWPLLYVNAVSYLGLIEAAGVADRTGHAAEAAGWRARAASLQAAWLNAMHGAELGNDRTYATGLWPSRVAATDTGRARLLRALGERRAARTDSTGALRERPLWTYFELAEAHQWLGLGLPDTAYATVRWFWTHQTAPGLFTWSEDSTEGNSYGRWSQMRGWVRPREVTPHYWTSAEMLLLQLEMLARLEPASPVVALVIGAGVPRAWLHRPLSVRGLQLRGRTIDWSWDGRRVRVRLRGRPAQVRLGPAFPPGTPVEIVREGAL